MIRAPSAALASALAAVTDALRQYRITVVRHSPAAALHRLSYEHAGDTVAAVSFADGMFVDPDLPPVSAYGSDQVIVQRYFTAGSKREMAKAVMLNGFLTVPLIFLLDVIGVGFVAYYRTHPALSASLPKPWRVPGLRARRLPLREDRLMASSVAEYWTPCPAGELDRRFDGLSPGIGKKHLVQIWDMFEQAFGQHPGQRRDVQRHQIGQI